MPEGLGGEQWGRVETERHLPDRSNQLDRFLGRMLRLVVRTMWRTAKLLLKGVWRLVRPSRRRSAEEA